MRCGTHHHPKLGWAAASGECKSIFGATHHHPKLGLAAASEKWSTASTAQPCSRTRYHACHSVCGPRAWLSPPCARTTSGSPASGAAGSSLSVVSLRVRARAA